MVSRTAEQWQKREFKFLQDEISKTLFNYNTEDQTMQGTFKLMYWMFKETAVNAVALVETASFTQYKSPIMDQLEYWIIVPIRNNDAATTSAEDQIMVMPDLWCSCPTFAKQVLQQCQKTTCRHLLALKLIDTAQSNDRKDFNSNIIANVCRLNGSHMEWIKQMTECQDDTESREQLNSLY